MNSGKKLIIYVLILCFGLQSAVVAQAMVNTHSDIEGCDPDKMSMDIQHSHPLHQYESQELQDDAQSQEAQAEYCEALCQIACHTSPMIPAHIMLTWQSHAELSTVISPTERAGFHPQLIRPPSFS